MCVMRYSLGHGLCAVCFYELHLESGGNYCGITDMSVESATKGENTACLLLGYCVSQEKIKVSAVPMASPVFFQPLNSHLPTLGSANRAHSEIQQGSWRHNKDQRYSWHGQHDTQQAEKPEAPQKKRRQDTQQVEEPETPLDGGSQWPPHSTWYCVAAILSVWATVEHWEGGGQFAG